MAEREHAGTIKAVFRVAAELGSQQHVVLFFDEIDALTGSRGSDHDGSGRVLTELLIQMTELRSASTNVILIAATNRPEQVRLQGSGLP